MQNHMEYIVKRKGIGPKLPLKEGHVMDADVVTMCFGEGLKDVDGGKSAADAVFLVVVVWNVNVPVMFKLYLWIDITLGPTFGSKLIPRVTGPMIDGGDSRPLGMVGVYMTCSLKPHVARGEEFVVILETPFVQPHNLVTSVFLSQSFRPFYSLHIGARSPW